MFARKVTVVACSTVALGLLGVSPAGCASDMYVGAENTTTTPPAFEAPPDAAADVATRTLTDYCASNKCPEGWTTCLGSKFLCDVDLRSDPKNCGACGAACPMRTSTESFDCIEGRCVLQCNAEREDCDGVIDNGCEADLRSDDHCGSCGNKCAEDAPCIRQPPTNQKVACGCTAPNSYCKPDFPWQDACVDLRYADNNCGACGNVCDPTGGFGAPPALPNTQYGCGDGECGKFKCMEGYADCNMDIGQPNSDGCETRLSTHDNCGQCGDNCHARGMNCVLELFKGVACRCPAGENFCGISFTEPFIGMCANFATDEQNCGACWRACPGPTTRSQGVCEYGECKLECAERWADCNGNVNDDCEVDIYSDPQNCGGCGIACDIAAGQACAGGRCVVEPCSGEVAR